MSPKSRIAIFAHFSSSGGLVPHARLHLEALRESVDCLVLVTNSPLDKDRELAGALCDRVIERKNRGWDFAAWRDALAKVSAAQFDWAILTNSSVVGPLFPINPILNKMEASDCDFWGMARSQELAPHLPSWFLSFSSKVLNSEAWMKFWSAVDDNAKKRRVIRDYELGLTKCLEQVGFKSAFVTEFQQWRLEATPRPPFLVYRNNDTLLDPMGMLSRGVPYVKASHFWGPDQHRGLSLPELERKYPDFAWDQLGLPS